MSIPKRLIIEYEDGSTQDIQFDRLSASSQIELSKKASSEAPAPKRYLLLHWKDGWSEVLGVDGEGLELLRYYIIERVEEVGRMAFDTEAAYPFLCLIKRLPEQLKDLTIIGAAGEKRYAFQERGQRKIGGTIEHVIYDRSEGHPAGDDELAGKGHFGEMLHRLEAEFDKRGLVAGDLLAGPDENPEMYLELAQALGIRAVEDQSDVSGLIRLMIQRLANPG